MSSQGFTWEKPGEQAEGKTPVTVVSGSLGAGKTSLLEHLIRSAKGIQLAVIVNDLGSVNLDGARMETLVGENSPLREVVQLSDGCLCCTLQSDLADALVFLLSERKPDQILIESSGVGEPWQVLRSFYSRNQYGYSLADRAVIQGLVTVVDVEAWGEELNNNVEFSGRRRQLLLGDRRRPLFELWMEQVDIADILVLNKVDRISPDDRRRVSAQLHDLNPRAKLLETEWGKVDPQLIFGPPLFSHKETVNAARWKSLLLDTHSSSGPFGQAIAKETTGFQAYGFHTFVWRSRQPLPELAFLRLFQQNAWGLVRGKGFFWSEERPDEVGSFSLAGKCLRVDYAGKWWRARQEAGESISLADLPRHVQSIWTETEGDRRQELVFIGRDPLGLELLEESLEELVKLSDASAKAGPPTK